MGKRQPEEPTPVDPVALANAQGSANDTTALLQSHLNNPNVVSPYGNINETFNPSTNQWTQTTQLSPAEQALYDQSTAAGGRALGIANDQLGNVQQALNTPLNAPQLMAGWNSGPIASGYNPGGGIQMQVGGSAGPSQNWSNGQFFQPQQASQQFIPGTNYQPQQNQGGGGGAGQPPMQAHFSGPDMQQQAQPIASTPVPGAGGVPMGGGSPTNPFPNGVPPGFTPGFGIGGAFGGQSAGGAPSDMQTHFSGSDMAGGAGAPVTSRFSQGDMGQGGAPIQSQFSQGDMNGGGAITSQFSGAGAGGAGGPSVPVQSRFSQPDMGGGASGPYGSPQQQGQPYLPGSGGAGQIQGGVNPSTWGDQAINQAQNAAYQQQAQYLDPQWQQSNEHLNASLIAQGLNPNDAAYQNAQQMQGLQQNQAYQGAMNAAVGAGQSEQNTLFNQGIGAGQFANTAQAQQYGENLQSGEFANAAQAQQEAQNAQQAAFYNTAQQQGYGEGQGNAAFYNQAADQGFQNQAYAQNQPINQFDALMSSGQVQGPQLGQFGQTAVAPTDVLGAYALNQQQQNANYQSQMANYNSGLGGLFSLGSAALSFI